jgi:hypothetical protein
MAYHWRRQTIVVAMALLGMGAVSIVAPVPALSAQATPAATLTPRLSQELAHAVVTKRPSPMIKRQKHCMWQRLRQKAIKT